jgi:hypothetical protein
MAIARKPSRKAASAVDVEALINRGGSPGGSGGREGPAGATGTTPILLRIPAGMMERLESALKDRPVKLPRHTWILEAIHEKLTRESPEKE